MPTTAAVMPGREVAVADQPDARAALADLGDQLLVARPIQDDHDQVVDVAAEALRDRLQVVLDGRVDVDLPFDEGPTTSLSM